MDTQTKPGNGGRDDQAVCASLDAPAAEATAPPTPDAAAEQFVHLAVHSEYSVSDGLVRIKDLVARAAQLDMPAVALTDRGNLFALVKFHSACRDAGVKALIGVDVDYEDEGGNAHRCVVLVASRTGYRNLLRLVSSAYTHGAGGHGRVALDALLDAADGLVALLGVGSDVGAALAADADAARRRLARWQQAFGDRVYLEAVRTGRPGEDRFVVDAAGLAIATGAPVVATNDVRFLDRDDFEAHETRVCIQEGRVLNDPRRERRYSEEQYLRSPAEMRALFADMPEALANSVEIAKRCSYEMELGTYYLPDYPAPPDTTLDALLEQRAREGVRRHLGELDAQGAAPDADAYAQRLDYELGVITQMGFSGYFLIVQEFVGWAREHAVPVGCRGSGTASLVAFGLGITDLDPLAYDLLFERLLNPERVSMPDLDIDLCMERREEVISHVAERYGADAVSQIVTFGTMAAKAVVRDVARAQDKPFGLADRLSKLIPFELGMTLAKAMKGKAELREFVERNDDAAEIMDMAYNLEGIVRGTGKHAGGVVIAPSALTDFVPLYADQAGGGVVSQFDLYDVEQAGLVKFDLLGLRTLTIIDWAVAAVNAERRRAGQAPVDVKNLPLGDARTFEFLKTAETTAVFQLESEGMKELIRRLQPDSIEDIIALVALYRPGPLQSGAVDDYIDRKHGRKRVEYAHPSLEDALRGTYGVMLYQEQVMTMAQLLAGFSLGQADLLRRAMAKKKPEEMAPMRAMFLEGTDAGGIDRRVATGIFDQVEKFAGYAFPKAHAASYAMLTFQAAWLKAHHPAQFMAAVLSADMQEIDKVVTLVEETARLGVKVQPPDVNASEFRFRAAPADGAGFEVRYGLGAVRGVGEGPVEAIVAERERDGAFAGLDEFCLRVDAKRVNKRVLEALIHSGAMDSFAAAGESIDAVRARLIDELPRAVQGAEQAARGAQLGVEDMFGGVAEPAAPAATPAHRRDVRPLSRQQRLEGEKETLGLYLTGHPLDDYLGEIRRICPNSIAKLRAGQSVRVGGLVFSHRTRRGRRGDMAFTVLDDRSGRIEASSYDDIYASNRAKLAKDAVLVFEGDVQADEYVSGLKLNAKQILTMAEARQRYARGVAVHVGNGNGRANGGKGANGDFVAELKQILGRHRSDRGCAVTVHYAAAGASGRVVLGDAWRVEANDALLAQLRETFGDGAVAMDYDGA